jgi:penicillin-binding protein 2
MTDEKIIKFFTRRLFLFFSFKIFLFFVLVSRLFYLQIIKHKYFLQKSNSNSLRKIQIPLKRGSIFDSNERLLAASVKVYVVFVKLDKIQDSEEFFKKYEKIFELNQEEKKYFKKSLNEFLSFDSSFFIQINKEN